MRTRFFIALLFIMLLVFTGCTLIMPRHDDANMLPRIESFNINPATIQSGQAAMLSWEVSNALQVNIEPGLKGVDLTGSNWVNPAQTTSYTIKATNEYGTSESALSLYVTEPVPAAISAPPEIRYFQARPGVSWAGADVILNWEVTNAVEIYLESDHGDSYDINNENGTIILQPVLTTVYKLVAKNDHGSSEFEALVNIRQDEQSGQLGGGGGGGGGSGGGGGGG